MIKKYCINPIRGCIVTLLLTLSIFFFGFLTGLCAIISWIVPWQTWRHHTMKVVLKVPVLWSRANHIILQIFTYKKWDISGQGTLKKHGWYMLICNHQSWFDILVLSTVFSRKLPIIKFFLKKELVWSLPLIGFLLVFLDYPIMHRHSREEIRKNPKLKGKDIETTKLACQKFKLHPTTIMNFVEGTRFKEEKRIRTQSPYRHLLKPKTGGIAVVCHELAHQLDGIVNATIHYSSESLSFWQLVCGNFDKITVRYNVLPLTQDLIGNYYEDRQFRARVQQWLNQIWQEKDLLLEELSS